MRAIRISAAALLLWGAAAFPQAETLEELARRAVSLQQTGDYAAAADAYRAILKIAPNDVATHVNLGVVLVQLGRFEEAIAEYQAADRLLPGDSRIALNLALAYEKSGDVRQARERFAKLQEAAPGDTKLTMLLADCNLQLGDDDRVIELLQPLEAQNTGDLAVDYMLGMALLHKQRVAEAQVLLDRILKQGDTAEARFLLGVRMFEAQDYPAAVKQLASAAELNPKLPQLQTLYGRALLHTGDPDGAAAAFESALAQNPNDFEANLAFGQILVARRQFGPATPVLQRARSGRPQSVEAKLALAQALAGAGHFGDARPLAEAAANDMPRSADAQKALRDVYAGLHRDADAAKAGRQLAALSRADAENMPGPKVSESAPDFALNEASSGRGVRLSDFRGRTPVVLVFGSYSCPNMRSSAEALKAMYARYGSRVPFLLVYIREAHSTGKWQSTRNEREDVSVAPAATLSEKQEHAVMCSRKLHLPFQAVVDGMDGAVETAYGAWPSRAFVIGVDGRVLYSTRLTELDFEPAEMDRVLHRIALHARAAK